MSDGRFPPKADISDPDPANVPNVTATGLAAQPSRTLTLLLVLTECLSACKAPLAREALMIGKCLKINGAAGED